MIRKSSSRCRPYLEQLEDRNVPTGIQLTQVGSTLTISGTPNEDRVRITDNGAGTIGVYCDPNPSPQFFAAITAINVNLRGGNDVLRYEMLSGLGAFSPLTLTANLGRGRDVFNGNLNGNDLFFGANYRFNIRGQQGTDTLTMDATNNTDVFQGATLEVVLNGASSNLPSGDTGDSLQFNYLGFLGGNLSIVEDGDGNNNNVGNDSLFCSITLTPGSNGRVFAREFGRRGRDELTMNIVQQPPVSFAQQPLMATIDAVIDGGPGRDRCVSTPNVTIINCP